ncbi:hypothetical protein PSHT_11331, partial [Puccinia striiformis]
MSGGPVLKARTSRDQTISTQPLLQWAPGKRITLPVRVEPELVNYHHHLVSEVFFANEQTFFSWLNFTVVLGGLAVGLLNFGDRVGQISAGFLTLHVHSYGSYDLQYVFPQSMPFSLQFFALITFHWRANAVRKRGSGNCDDCIGPTALCITLL